MNQLTENLREVRGCLENITERPDLKEAPVEVRDHFYSALGHLSRAIQLMMFKYNNVDFLAEPLVEILINNLNLNNLKNDVDMVVPVPLFWWRRFKRGFNQSELLAKRIGRHLLLPVSTNNLYRIKNTIPQTRLSRSQRQQNMHRAFAIKRTEDFKNRRVLLVDDVLTTGVTASECARAIKTAGGEKVYVLTIAGASF